MGCVPRPIYVKLHHLTHWYVWIIFIVQCLSEEWGHVFCDNIFQPIIRCFVALRNLEEISQHSLEPSSQNCDDQQQRLYMNSLCRSAAAAFSMCPAGQLLAHPTPTNLIVNDILSLPNSTRHTVLLSVLRGLLRPLHVNRGALLWGAFGAWYALATEMAGATEEASNDMEQVPLTQSLQATLEIAADSQLFAEVMSSGGSAARVDLLLGGADAADRHLLASYLLAWHVVLEQFGAATAELRAKMASWLESTRLLSVLLGSLVRLVPPAARADAWSEAALRKWRPEPSLDTTCAKVRLAK